MSKHKFQFSILGFLVLIAFAGIGLSVWRQAGMAKEIKELRSFAAEVESGYRVRSRALAVFGSFDLKDEKDLEALRIARAFAPSLSELRLLGEESSTPIWELDADMQLVDADGAKGKLELLLLTQTAKASPGWDRSIVALFNSDKLLDVLPTETFTRTWHEVIVRDLDNDGTMDFSVQEYWPSAPPAKRQVSKEVGYIVTKTGFESYEIHVKRE